MPGGQHKSPPPPGSGGGAPPAGRYSGSGGPSNWHHECGGPDLSRCTFAADYAALIDVLRGLGRSAAGPQVYVAVPPPLMEQGAYGMNQSVINDVLPRIVPLIGTANNVTGIVDV